MTNLNLAFDIAEKHLDIPKMLDAEGKFPYLKPSIRVFVSELVKFSNPRFVCRSRRGRQT